MPPHRDHVRQATADVFDDEYAVDDFDGVADGFAPGRVQNGDTRWSIHSDDPSIVSVNAHMADAPRPSVGPSRSSMHKSRDMANPFTSVEDDDDNDDHDRHSALQRSHSLRSTSTAQYAPGIAHRLSNASSARHIDRTTSPLVGASGPSHPYSMYPQGTTVARTPSISTTTSTIRPNQSTLPTHPYSMYPQNVSEDVDDVEPNSQPSHAQVHIPVGFPGRNQAYVRRQGPEGEEHDIIGVDGHSEQLPPYSEYPEDGVPKPIVLPGQALASHPPQSATQVNLPLMQEQRHAPQSMSDEPVTQGYINMQQMDSSESISPSSASKSWSEKSWKEKRKTRFCGIPFWWILLSFCVVAFIAIVLGASIGGFMANAKKQVQKHPNSQPPSTTLLDASPIPSSSTGTPPPTGVYALSFGSPRATQSACLTNSSYADAWSCNFCGSPEMAIDVGYPSNGGSNTEGATLYGINNSSGISYGTQPPSTHFSQFISVQDDDEPYRGPAFYFQTFHDKFVIAPENAFSMSSTNSKRDSSYYIESDWYTERQVVAGDKPWFCFWNGTFLEGFVYANNYTNPSSSSSSAASTSPPLTTSTIIEVSGPSTTSTLTSGYQATSTSPPYTGSNQRRQDSDDSDDSQSSQTGDGSVNFQDIAAFGYVLKIEERRVPDSPQPYCQQYQILDDGTAGILTGNLIMLNESDPDYSAYQTQTANKKKRSVDLVSGGCHCEWWSGAGYS